MWIIFLFYCDSGYNGNLGSRYPSQSQYGNSNSGAQFDNRVGLALGPPQSQPSSSSSFQSLDSSVQHSSLTPFEDWPQNQDKGVQEFLPEEEIRIRSHEMLENEDMQHLLRLFSMGGQAPVNGPEDGYAFPSYMASPLPEFTFDEDRSRPGKAVVGWLKIKAAMRWGFFIRKKAAERRAQIVELEDD